MSKCAWIIAIALGLNICLANLARAQPVDENARGGDRATERQQQPSADINPAPPPSIQDLLQRIAGALEAGNDKPESDAERERAKRDLSAQEAMAKWAKWMLIATSASVIIGGFSLFLIWRTVIYAKQAAVAAHATVNVSKEIGVAQTRSYISVIGGGFILNKGGYSGFIDVSNSGHSPAVNPKIEVTINLAEAWFGGATMGAKPPHRDIQPFVGKKDKIQPGETSRFYFFWTKEQIAEIFDLLNHGRNTVVLTCKLSSETIYPKVVDKGAWQLTNYPGFVRVTDESRVAEGVLYPRQSQKK